MMIKNLNINFNFKLYIMQKILLIVIAIIIFGCGKGSAQAELKKKTITKKAINSDRPKNAVKAPDFTLADLSGDPVTLKDLEGSVVLLTFWGTWCGPCRREIPDFIKLYDKYNTDGLEIVGITLTSGPPDAIQRFVDRYGINYTVLTDIQEHETQMATADYGRATGQRISGIPTTFIIDREGYIVKRYVGPRPEHIFYQDLKPYL